MPLLHGFSMQGWRHEFEGWGVGSMHLKVGGVNTVKTLKFEKGKMWGCLTPPPAPMVAPPLGVCVCGGGVITR